MLTLEHARQALSPALPALSTLVRCFASAAPATVEHVRLEGEAVHLVGSADKAVVLRLPERPFSPVAELSSDQITRILGSSDDVQHVAVVREAFTPFDQQPQRLTQLLGSLGRGAVALASSTQAPEQRLLVDLYARSARGEGAGGPYRLQRVGADLTRYLHQQGLRLALTQDVAAAAAAAARGNRGGLSEAGVLLPNSVAVATRPVAQSTNRVLMVAPTAFGFNEQAAQDNSFMHVAEKPEEGSPLTRAVLAEFAGLYRQLTDVAGVQVSLFQHHLRHGTPDAVFPNNWFSTHYPGEGGSGTGSKGSTLVLYPMKCRNRAAERRPEIVQVLKQTGGYSRVVDLSGLEPTGATGEGEGQCFEGTGVLVLDRVNGVAYVALSERADREVAEHWVDALGYKEMVTFHSHDARDKAVYHTNVMMAVGTDVAVVCLESVQDPRERQHLQAKLSRYHTVVPITSAQMDALCGNVLEVQSGYGLPVLAMSTQAYKAFTPEQRAVLRRHVADLIHAPIDTLEKVGGGGVRCSLGELF